MHYILITAHVQISQDAAGPHALKAWSQNRGLSSSGSVVIAPSKCVTAIHVTILLQMRVLFRENSVNQIFVHT